MRLVTQLQFRRRTAAEWTRENPILEDGEPGYEKDTGRFKVGNGLSRWAQLGYFESVPLSGSLSGQALLDHINSLTPHPVYDDGPSLVLLYENAKV